MDGFVAMPRRTVGSVFCGRTYLVGVFKGVRRMKKEEMVTLLRSAGVDENAVTLAVNAWELGSECEREACATACEQAGIDGLGTLVAAVIIRKRGIDDRSKET